MKRALLLIMVIAIAIAGCKKDEETTGGDIIVRTKLAGGTDYVEGITVKLFNIDNPPASLAYEGITGTLGNIDVRGLPGGQYKVEASYADTVQGSIEHYETDSTIQLTDGTSLTIDLTLLCTNCCALSCGANGTLVNANGICACDCDAGYEGAACDTLSRAKFVGIWGVTENCSTSGSGIYSINITVGSGGVDQVLITNFWNAYVSPVYAVVLGDEITIASQDPDGDGYLVSGTGNITSTGGVSTITLSYIVQDSNTSPPPTDACSATLIRQ